MVLTAQRCGVILRTEEEKDKWKVLAKLSYRVARYPCSTTLRLLGIKQCFEELLEEGHLTTLFTPGVNSYHRLTLEFLTTLEVVMDRRVIASIRFRLRNEPYELTMEAFKDMYGFLAEDHSEPRQFHPHAFWQAITDTKVEFHANRAKGSHIRNPVLRMLQKACVCHPFARTEQGSVQRDELFLLWSVVNKRPANWAVYLIRQLKRASKKTTDTLCCGAVVGFIARHLGVDTRGFTPDMGESLMDIAFLKRTEMIGVDRAGRAYLLQKIGGHYPLPDGVNTYINGPTFPDNWGMNRDVHMAAIANNPQYGPFQDRDPSFIYEENLQLEAPEQRMEDDQPEAEDRDDEDAQPQHGDPGAGPSRRRNREEHLEEDIGFLNTRMESLEMSYQRMSERQEAHWARQDERWDQFTTHTNNQWANFHAVYDERWNTYLQHVQEFRGYWPPQPPPSDDQ